MELGATAIIMVHNIEQALSTLDPASADAYKTKTEAYQAQLVELDGWVKEQIESIPAENRVMVTDHDAFGYYADRYGLEIVGTVIPAYSTNAEPSAQELAELQDTIREVKAKAVFVGTTVNAVLSQQVAEDRYIRGLVIYLDVLNAQITRFQAEDNLALVDLAIMRNRVALHRALGGGWAEPEPVTVKDDGIFFNF